MLEVASETPTSLTLDYPLDLSLRLIEPVPLPNLRHLYLLNSSIGHQNLKGVDHWLFKLKGLETFDYESGKLLLAASMTPLLSSACLQN